MERLGKVYGKNVYYFHWNHERRNYYLEKLPKKEKWLLFVIGDDKLNEEYKLLAEKSVEENLIEMSAAGIECELIHDIFDGVIIEKERVKGTLDTTEAFNNTTMTVWNTNKFDSGYWGICACDGYEEEDIKIGILICVDFTSRGVKKYLKHITKLIRKGWLPRTVWTPYANSVNTKPIYDDEIIKPLKRSQRGFDKRGFDKN